MNQWKLVPEAIDECAKPDVWNSAYAAGWNDCRKRMLAAAPAPDVQPAIYPEEARQMGLEEVAYYTHPPAPQLRPLTEDETMHLMNETAGRQHWADEAHIQRFRQAVERAHGIGEGKI